MATVPRAAEAALLIAGALGLAACGSTSTGGPTVATTPVTTQATTSIPAPKAAGVGSTFKVGGEHGTADLTLVRIVDPAKDAYDGTPDPGTRFLGVKLSYKALTSSYSDVADGGLDVIGSNAQTYTSQLSDIAGCTNFNSGQVTLTLGSTAVGCVEFQLPDGITVATVQYTADDGLSGSVEQWKVASATSTTTTVAPPTTTATAATKQLAAKFLALVAPVNAEIDVLDAKYPKGPTLAEQLPLVAPVTAFDNALLRIGLTGQAATDARALVVANSELNADIQNDNLARYNSDSAAFSAADNALRADLGLPPAPS